MTHFAEVFTPLSPQFGTGGERKTQRKRKKSDERFREDEVMKLRFPPLFLCHISTLQDIKGRLPPHTSHHCTEAGRVDTSSKGNGIVAVEQLITLTRNTGAALARVSL